MENSAKAPRAHRGAVYALLVAATITAFLAVFAVWVQRQVLNGDNWTRSSSQLLQDTAIRTTVSGYLVDQLYANVDVAGELRASLPPELKGLAAPAAGGLRSAAENVTNKALQRPRVQELWENANRRAHARLIKVLEGGGPALQTTGGVVTLDLGGLLGQIEERVGVGGRLADKVPPGAAQIEIMRSDQLALAQDVFNLLRPLAIGLVVLAIALFALAVWLARGWRRQALRGVGIGFLIAGIAALLVRRFGEGVVVDSLASTASIQPAIESTWRIETSLLADAATASILYGVAIVLAAWLAGTTGLAVGTRRALAPYLREPAYAYGGLAVIVLLLLVWAPTQALRQPLTALVLIAFIVAGFEVLRRRTAREFPDAERNLADRARAAWGRIGGGRAAGAEGGASPAPAAPHWASVDPVEKLERVAALHERGVLTDEEFAAEKQEILAAAR